MAENKTSESLGDLLDHVARFRGKQMRPALLFLAIELLVLLWLRRWP